MKYILIVDDDSELRENLREVLTLRGYEVQEASGGEDALKKIEFFPLEVFLTDCQMPGMSGIELARRVLSLKPDVKIIVMSGRKKFREQTKKIGKRTSFIEKPFSINELEKLIKS